MPDLVINESLIDRQQSFSGWIYSEEDQFFGAAFPDKLIVPRSDWRDVYEENERKGLSLRRFRPYVFDQNPESSCFPAGTRIRMADGESKPIETILTGEKVLTAENHIGTVTATGRRETEEIWRLKPHERGMLALTGEHPVLTKRGYVEARLLGPEDAIATPANTRHDWAPLEYCDATSWHGHVFNLEVEGDNSYVAEGIGVHNCVYNSAAGCHMAIWNRTYGVQHQVILSPMSGYCQQTRRRHSGSTMWGAMEHMTEHGLLPSSGHGQREKYEHTLHENHPFIQRESLPSGWQETAKIFRVEEWCRLDDPVQFGSALCHGYPVCYGRSGHCIMGGQLVFANGNKPLCEYCCSYGTSRGNGGWLYDSERMWSTGGAWCARSIKLVRDPRKPWEG